MRKHNRFTSRHGKSTFKCQVCERNTRDSGQGVDHLCYECYEIAGLDNMVNDGGHNPGSPDYDGARKECDALLAKAVKLGGNGKAIMESNSYIWSAKEVADYVAPAARQRVAVGLAGELAKAFGGKAVATKDGAEVVRTTKTKAVAQAQAQPGTKRAKLLAMVTRKGGATMQQMLTATGWKACRGTLGAVVAAAGLTLSLDKETGRYTAR